MPQPKDIKKIVVHCSAGFGDRVAIDKHWKSLGWNSPGYHRLVGLHGEIYELAKYEAHTNGVKGNNSTTLHVCYIGGVTKQGDKFIAKDTRTDEQKKTIIFVIQEMQKFIAKGGGNPANVQIVGHRDFSTDQNHDGIIASWERIKECPSFDAIPEYKHLVSPAVNASNAYAVIAGDTLSMIAQHFGTTVASLKTRNNLTSDLIKVGQILKL